MTPDDSAGSEYRLGAFARIFQRANLDELAKAFTEHNLTQVQLNLTALGLPTIPRDEQLDRLDVGVIRRTLEEHGRVLWGISATFNASHPDAEIRRAESHFAARFIAALDGSGAVAATLCSGSRDPQNMWGRHPDTSSEAAWRDFRESLDVLLPAAETAGVLLAIEPEPANTVMDTDRALRLVAELGSDADRIGFILDPANLISDVPAAQHASTLERAFNTLGAQTICVHAKDTVPWSTTLTGGGVVDYDLVARLYGALPKRVPLIIQDATEAEIDPVVQLMRSHLHTEAVA